MKSPCAIQLLNGPHVPDIWDIKTDIMKTKQFIIFTLVALVLTSCGMGSFSTQKYTDFKKKKMYAEQHIGHANHTEFNEIETSKSENEVDIHQEDDPKTIRIKAAIQQKESIILVKDTNYFKLQDGTYDQFYKQLHGKLVPIHRDSIASNALVLHTKKELKSGSFFQDVEELHYSTSTVEKPDTAQNETTNTINNNKAERPTFKERRSWPEVTKEEEKASYNAKRTKQFFGASVALFLGAFLALIIALFSWSLPFVIAAIFLFALSQVFSVASFVFAQKYRIETRNKKKRRRLGMRFITGLLFIGMYYLLMLFVSMGASIF